MFDNEDNPIKEYNPIRIGIDDLAENDEINNIETDFKEYNDLHECSNDLSDAGSRKEELAHARYAEIKRRNLSQNNIEKVLLSGETKWIWYGLILICVVIPVIRVFFEMIGLIIMSLLNNL